MTNNMMKDFYIENDGKLYSSKLLKEGELYKFISIEHENKTSMFNCSCSPDWMTNWFEWISEALESKEKRIERTNNRVYLFLGNTTHSCQETKLECISKFLCNDKVIYFNAKLTSIIGRRIRGTNYSKQNVPIDDLIINLNEDPYEEKYRNSNLYIDMLFKKISTDQQ